ncbi:hypothetical protein SAMN04515674_107117 [Pseudarcicella hirudinis]|uniref:Uncharacterized protein n=1 Tax=Pseudarcicella hirudinis TaxID=1079859 RepID=A0A1I5UD00_9BACT|nr:hypothetical protein [Pseudarcicella hirudinis]SFP93180.1 hypothetical protein SAMN04515674_107117 [Pseudarcicella hirudinis]
MVYRSNEEVESLVRSFLTCQLPVEAWTHEAHLTVGIWHLLRYTPIETLLLMRVNIISYNQSVNTPNNFERGYHETLTWFWIKTLHEFLEDFGREQSLTDTCNALFSSKWSDRNRALQFYEREKLFSVEARARIIE